MPSDTLTVGLRQESTPQPLGYYTIALTTELLSKSNSEKKGKAKSFDS